MNLVLMSIFCVCVVFAHNGEFHPTTAGCAGTVVAGPVLSDNILVVGDMPARTISLYQGKDIIHTYNLNESYEMFGQAAYLEMTRVNETTAVVFEFSSSGLAHYFVSSLEISERIPSSCNAGLVRAKTSTDGTIYIADMNTGKTFIFDPVAETCTPWIEFPVDSYFIGKELLFFGFDVFDMNTEKRVLFVGERKTRQNGIVVFSVIGSNAAVLWTPDADLSVGQEYSSNTLTHMYGDVIMDSESTAVIALGEFSSQNKNVQDSKTLIGKTSVFNLETGDRIRTCATGLRHPWTMQKNGSIYYVGDVGDKTYETIKSFSCDSNVVLNFMWPIFEGPYVNNYFAPVDTTAEIAEPTIIISRCDTTEHGVNWAAWIVPFIVLLLVVSYLKYPKVNPFVLISVAALLLPLSVKSIEYCGNYYYYGPFYGVDKMGHTFGYSDDVVHEKNLFVPAACLIIIGTCLVCAFNYKALHIILFVAFVLLVTMPLLMNNHLFIPLFINAILVAAFIICTLKFVAYSAKYVPLKNSAEGVRQWWFF